MKWEYKTIRVLSMDDWLGDEYALSVTAKTGVEAGDEDEDEDEEEDEEEDLKSRADRLARAVVEFDKKTAVRVKAITEIFSKHITYLNEQLGILGQDGWELVSIWTSDPAILFDCDARQWMTFKRSV